MPTKKKVDFQTELKKAEKEAEKWRTLYKAKREALKKVLAKSGESAKRSVIYVRSTSFWDTLKFWKKK